MIKNYLTGMPVFVRFILMYGTFGGLLLLINRKRIIAGLKTLNKG